MYTKDQLQRMQVMREDAERDIAIARDKDSLKGSSMERHAEDILVKLDSIAHFNKYGELWEYNPDSDELRYEDELVDNAKKAYEQVLLKSGTKRGSEYRELLVLELLDTSAIVENYIEDELNAIVNPHADNMLYYLALKDGTYKIGFTSLSKVKDRYPSVNEDDYKIIYAKRLVNARQVESLIKERFKDYCMESDSCLGTSGTEVYSINILG